MEYKYSTFELKADDEAQEDSTFSGYVSVFNNRDLVGDVMLPNSFKASLETRHPKLLWNHDQNTVIGVIQEIYEDTHGLFIKGQFANTPKGQEVRELMKIGAVREFSIGYIVRDYEFSSTSSDRLLKQVDLWECSAVTFPANPEAKLSSVKSIEAEVDEKVKSLIAQRHKLLA